MKRKVYTDGNGGSSVLIEGLGAYVTKVKLEALKVQVEKFKEIARQHTKLASRGIYYTMEELAEHDREVAAKAVDSFADHLISTGRYGDGDASTFRIITYVNKIKSGKVKKLGI